MLDAWFKPQPIVIERVQRTPTEKREMDERTASLTLYHYDTCMFCAQVREVIDLLSLKIEFRDIVRDSIYRRELIDGGGRSTVPCLRIVDSSGRATWMYESIDIIRYLAEEFGRASGNEEAAT